MLLLHVINNYCNVLYFFVDSTKARRRRDIPRTHPPYTTKPLTTYSDAVAGTKNPSTDSKFGSFHTTSSPRGTTRHRTTGNSWNSWNSWTTPTSYQPSYLPYSEYGNVDREYLPSEDEVNENVLFLERFTTAVTKVPIDVLKPAGHQFEDLVTECSWRGYDCKNRYESGHGMCLEWL